jgi:hypothetical protein
MLNIVLMRTFALRLALCHFLLLGSKESNQRKIKKGMITAHPFRRSLIKQLYYCDFAICISFIASNAFFILMKPTTNSQSTNPQAQCPSPQYYKSLIEIPHREWSVIIPGCLFLVLFWASKKEHILTPKQC